MQTPITEIAGYPYPDRISHFRQMCRNYKVNEYWLRNMEHSFQAQSRFQDNLYDYENGKFRTSQEMKERYGIVKNNVVCVDKTLEKIRMFYGSEAEEMVREAYVAGKSRKEIAEKYHLSENALQRKYRVWLENVIYEDSEEHS